MPPVLPILLAACGNALAADDGLGPAVVRALRPVAPPTLEILDLALAPADVLDHLAGRAGLIIVDAAVAPDLPPGQILDLDYFSPTRPALLSDRVVSTHALGLGGQLALADRLGLLPPVVRLLAVTIPPPQLGLPLTPETAALIPNIVTRILGLTEDLAHK